MLVTTVSAVAIAGTDASCLSGEVPHRSSFGGLNRQFLRGPMGDIGERIRLAAIAKTANDSSASFGLPVCYDRLTGGLALILNDAPHPSVEKDLMSIPMIRWGLMLIGTAIAFLAMDILLRRPLMTELASVKRDLAQVEKSLQNLVGVKDTAWETNHLLSALQAQKRQLESARAALGDIREFRTSVETEAQQTSEAVASLDRIAELQKQVVSQREQSAAVDQVLADIVKLHERLISQKHAQQEAVASVSRMSELHQQVRDAAKDSDIAAVEIQKLGDLRTKVLENSAGVEDAQRGAAELIALKDSVLKADDVATSQESANQLLALRDSLRPSDDSTEQSQAHAKELLTLRDDLAANVEDTQIAHRHWASVRKLEADMKQAGSDIANAIETLELLTDLSAELSSQTKLLAGLRQTLTEVAMLETTVGRAMRVLEPLAQLKNLTRLNEAEVRAAARAILDQRNSKLSRHEDLQPAPLSTKLPHEDSLFSDEPLPVIGSRLVPMPRDLEESDEPAPPVRTGAVE